MGEYISVGSPVGKIKDSEKGYFYVAGKMLGMEPLAYKVWLCFLGGNKIEQVRNNQELLGEADADDIERTAKELYAAGLMIEIDEIEDYIPLRNGIGAGYHEKKAGYYVIAQRTCKLNAITYFIWCQCDGKKKFQQILHELRHSGIQIAEEAAKEAIRSLLRASLVFLSLED